MDCKTVRLLLDFARPHAPEVDAADVVALDAHLADCPACAALAAGERRLDAALGTAMRRINVPDGLRHQLLNRLEADRSEYYRRWYGHGLRAALAASLLVAAVWGALYWRSKHLPDPRLDDFKRELFDAEMHGGSSKAEVDGFYRRQDVDAVAPDNLEYRYLRHYGMGWYLGRQVPYLVFLYTPAHRANDVSPRTEPGVYVEVYVLSARQFDLEKLKLGGDEGDKSYERKVFVERHPSGRYAYVYVYNGDSLDWVRGAHD